MAHSRQALPSADEIAKLPPDGGPEFNRLIFESSPYLLQHARNPVDWYPWGSEAFARAKAENKPVFVSIGYSTCHWCHVMEAESFEQQDVAAILNRDYICIKVDREERPDIDQIYVTVTQMLLGRAGWPDNIWMLPDGRPFHVSTYIQKEDSPVYGPGFKTVLTQMASLYKTHRAEVEADASEIDKALKEFNSKLAPPAAKLPGRELPATTLRILAGQFDQSYGGFGVAPKFPPHGHLALLSYSLLDSADEKQLQMLTTTLDAMANGGIRDHVGGGFHRYSTDAQWVLPHFEKMLYDSAQLARAYTDGYLLTGNEYYAEVARQTCDWLVSEMQSPEGGFYSAWDADSEGEEGRYYTWTRDEVLKILGNEDGELFCRVYGVQAAGNYLDEATGEKTGRNVLLLVRSWDKAASAEKLDEKALREKMRQSREKLLAERDKRVPPELDDKVLADWNGLTLGSLAYCGRHLRESRYIESATKAASFLTGKMEQEGRLLHSWRGGKASIPGYLEDYTYLADGLLELYQSTGEQRWLEAAKKLTDELEQHFADAGGGGYFATPNDGELLLARERPYLDDVVPSGNGMAARVFVRLANLTGDQHYREQADRMLSGFSGAMQGAALSTESLQLALLMDLDHSTSAGQAGEPLLVNSNVGNPDAQPIPDAQSAVKPVSVAAYLSSLQALPGQSLRLALRINVDEGYHINAAEASGADLVPTSLLLDDNPAVSLEKIDWPTALHKAYGSQSEQLATYEGENWAIVHLTVMPDAPAGRLHLNFKLKAQPCADLACQLPVEHSLIIPFEILPADTKTKPAAHHASIFAQHGGRDTKLLSAVLRYFWAVAFIIVMYYAAKRIFGPKKGSGARPAA